MIVPDHLKGSMPLGKKGDNLRKERNSLLIKLSRDFKLIELAKLFQLSPTTVSHVLNSSGSPKTTKANSTIFRDSSKPIGMLKNSLSREPSEFIDWLLKETPEGGTVSETLIAIARDAYEESKEDTHAT